MIVTIIGRGHSGTRIISQLLHDNGFFMGSKLNNSYDKIPPDNLYKAVKIFNKNISFIGTLENPDWDFSKVINSDPSKEFKKALNSYLEDIDSSDKKLKGWKLPETIFILPWLIKLRPDIKYIIWWRNPFDAPISKHKSDRFISWNLKPVIRDDIELRGALSWYYQYLLIRYCAWKKLLNKNNAIEVKYEIFVKNSRYILNERLKHFLNKKLKLKKIKLHKDSIDKYLKDEDGSYNWYDDKYKFLKLPEVVLYGAYEDYSESWIL